MPYADNERQKQVASQARKNRVQTNKARLQWLKAETPCSDCGVQYPYYVMDFDHVQPGAKRNRRSMMDFVHRGWSWTRLEEEIKLCEIVCANCHRERTQQRLG